MLFGIEVKEYTSACKLIDYCSSPESVATFFSLFSNNLLKLRWNPLLPSNGLSEDEFVVHSLEKACESVFVTPKMISMFLKGHKNNSKRGVCLGGGPMLTPCMNSEYSSMFKYSNCAAREKLICKDIVNYVGLSRSLGRNLKEIFEHISTNYSNRQNGAVKRNMVDRLLLLLVAFNFVHEVGTFDVRYVQHAYLSEWLLPVVNVDLKTQITEASSSKKEPPKCDLLTRCDNEFFVFEKPTEGPADEGSPFHEDSPWYSFAHQSGCVFMKRNPWMNVDGTYHSEFISDLGWGVCRLVAKHPGCQLSFIQTSVRNVINEKSCIQLLTNLVLMGSVYIKKFSDSSEFDITDLFSPPKVPILISASVGRFHFTCFLYTSRFYIHSYTYFSFVVLDDLRYCTDIMFFPSSSLLYPSQLPLSSNSLHSSHQCRNATATAFSFQEYL